MFRVCGRVARECSSDGDDIEIARLLMATAAIKNQTDRLTAIVFAGRSVYTIHSNSPFPPYNGKLGARKRHGMLGLLLQLENVPIATFVLPKSPEQDPRLFCRQNRGPR